MRSSRRRDLAFAIAIIAVCALVLWEARKQPASPYEPIGAAGVPTWTAIIMIALAGSILVRIALGKSTGGDAKSLFTATKAHDDSYSTRPWLSLGTIVLTLIYALAIPYAGFMVATVAFLAALVWLLGDRSARTLAIGAALAIAAGVGLTAGFRALLIDLP
jgi:hypothetical protein